MTSQSIGITWQLSDRHGWGIFGLNLALNLIRTGPCPPLLFTDPNFIGIPEETANKIRACLWDRENQVRALRQSTVIHALANAFTENAASRGLRGRNNIAFVFFEQSDFDAAAIKRAGSWDRLMVGSSWNLQVCREYGLQDVGFVSQGVDTDLFAPAPRQGVPSGRFVIYSGGKLEYRKGQDLVLAAFKIFHRRHPDSLLVTAWQNSWAESAATIERSPLVQAPPETDAGGQLAITNWALDHGVPEKAFVDLGWVSNARLPAILNEVDLALFPSRCEGGTNLAAMEAMACGVPCVLSANTGHLDIIGTEANCYPLRHQTPSGPGCDRFWRDSDVDEMVDHMEQAYQDSEARTRIGKAAAEAMSDMSWNHQIEMLKTAWAPYL